MIRRLSVPWRDGKGKGTTEPVRLLAVSDEQERAFDFERNRADLGRLDAVLGCGDLEPAYLSFLADAFHAPLLFVRGNHDRGPNWTETGGVLPEPMDGARETIDGLNLIGLSWPGNGRSTRAVRDEQAAWRQVLKIGLTERRTRPLIVLSHVPPLGFGDIPEDYYHRGFTAYEWLLKRLRPTLWLHGHTSMAAARDWRVTCDDTTLVNVTGAVLVEIGGQA
jgi:Icc-related predicted phosphoesterase